MVRDQIYSTGGGSLRAASRYIHGSVMGPRMVSVPKTRRLSCRHFTSASITPRRPKISALCWPSLGGTLRTRTLSPILIGCRCAGPRPIPRRSRIERGRGGAPAGHRTAARKCGPGPHGTPAASSTSTQCSVVCVASTAFISASSAARFSMRSWLVAKRGSPHHSGCPSAAAQRAQIDWPAAPTIR